jgi:DNA invertase Pin-like site-specific DNA recombinase
VSTTAALYLRKSNDEGDRSAEVKSVAVQRALCLEYASAQGWTVDEAHVFVDDGISGAEFKLRPGLQALLAALDPAAPFKVLVVSEQSRLGRETLDTLLVVRAIEKAGVAIWSATERRQVTIKSDDEASELLTLLGGWRDKSERKKTITRVRNAARQRFSSGYVVGGKVYGYLNVRSCGGCVSAGVGICRHPATRKIDPAQAAIVRRIFEETKNGAGLQRIAKQLNAEGIAGPRYACGKKGRGAGHTHGDECPRGEWTPTGVREVLFRTMYRGELVSGQVQRDRDLDGKKLRVHVPESEWRRRTDESLRVVEEALWTAAHARIEETNKTLLRRGHRLDGQAENLMGRYLLSNFLACGSQVPAGSTRTHGGALCGEPLIAIHRGRRKEFVYVCRGHREKGDVFCTNATGVPADLIHVAVIQSLNKSFTQENFEAHARATTNDEQAREQRRAERETLLARVPVLSAECERLADAVAAGSGTLDVLLSAIKSRQSEREQAEARITELEGIERDLQADHETVERLKATWGDWSGALEADPVLARQVLRKVLERGSVLVWPVAGAEVRTWDYIGHGRFDGVLRGSVGGDSIVTRHPWPAGAAMAAPCGTAYARP